MSGTVGRGRSPVLWLAAFLYVPFLAHFVWYFRKLRIVDLPSFFWAAKLAFEQGVSPYDPQAFQEAVALAGQRVHPYLYPPPSLLVFYPLSLLSFDAARVLVLVGNHVMFLLLGYLLLWRVARLDRGGAASLAFFVAYLLLCEPVTLTIVLGQVNLLVLVLLLVLWLALREDAHPLLVGLPLSLAILVKAYPALFLLPLLAQRKYRAVAATLGLLALHLLVAGLVIPAPAWRDWLTSVLPTGGYGRVPLGLFSPAAAWNQSLNGFTSRLFLENEFSEALLPSEAAARSVPYLLAAALLGATLWTSWRIARRADAGRFLDLELSLWLVAMFAVAPLSWEHHLVFVLPAGVLALHFLIGGETRPRWGLGAGLAAFLIAWAPPLDAAVFKRGLLTLVISGELYAVLVLWVHLWSRARRALAGQALAVGFGPIGEEEGPC